MVANNRNLLANLVKKGICCKFIESCRIIRRLESLMEKHMRAKRGWHQRPDLSYAIRTIQLGCCWGTSSTAPFSVSSYSLGLCLPLSSSCILQILLRGSSWLHDHVQAVWGGIEGMPSPLQLPWWQVGLCLPPRLTP